MITDTHVNTNTNKPIRVLIAEDEHDISVLYKTAFEHRRHHVTITGNGEDCLKIYHEQLQCMRFENTLRCHTGYNNNMPFDVIILDLKMPKINGMEVAKEILAVNLHQRIIFASAYVRENLEESVKQLKQVVQLM